MIHNDTILVIVDPKARHHAALAKGALLAKKYRTRMELLSWGAAGQGARTLEREISGKLRNLAGFLRANGLDVRTEALPADLLCAALDERLKSARFVIKDATHAAGLQSSVLPAIDSELTRVCPAPLLLSKPKLWPELPLICAVVDPEQPGLALSDAVMTEGKTLADRLEGQLHVLHTHAAADDCVSGLRMFVTRLAGNVFVMGAAPRAKGTEEGADTTVDNVLKLIPCDLLVVKAAQATNTLH
jgi:universal stress protein E